MGSVGGRCGAGGGDGFQSGVDAERLKQAADVVPDRLGAQVELAGDLPRRTALLQETKDIDLARREMRKWRHPRAGGRDQDAGRLRCRGGAEDLSREELPGAGAVLGSDDRREVAASNITEQAPSRRVEPADDARWVEDVARDSDAVQSLLDVAADGKSGSHRQSVTETGERLRSPRDEGGGPASIRRGRDARAG